MADLTDLQKKLDEAQHFLRYGVRDVIGVEAVNHFEDSFQNEGFTDRTLVKWKDVKRRDPNSKWYGFAYNGEKRTYYRMKRDRKTGKTYKSDKQKRLNFSSAATSRKILTGGTKELGRSIDYKKAPGQVIVYSDKPYAQVQNEGGEIRIFGKASSTLDARQFMGKSEVLESKWAAQTTDKLNQIFNK